MNWEFARSTMARSRMSLVFIALSVLVPALFSTVAFADDWQFYGSARFATYNIRQSEDVVTNPRFFSRNNPTNAERIGLQWSLQANSRIGGRVSHGNVEGHFEYGANLETLNLRHLYGIWNYGRGSLMIGQTWTPITGGFSNQAGFGDEGLFNHGDPFAGRRPQLRWTIGGYKLAFIQPNIVPGNRFVGSTFTEDTDSLLPKVEMSYRYGWNRSYARVFGGFQTYNLVDASNNSAGINSFLLGAMGRKGFGAGGLHGSLYYGQNLGAYGALESALVGNLHFDNDLPQFEDGSLKNARTLVGSLVFDWQFTERFRLESGYGYREMRTETDIPRDQTAWVAYGQIRIQLASTVMIVPEIGYYNFGYLEQGVERQNLGYALYYGAKTQIDF